MRHQSDLGAAGAAYIHPLLPKPTDAFEMTIWWWCRGLLNPKTREYNICRPH